MDQSTQLVALLVAVAVGLVAVVAIMRRQRHDVEDANRESPFAVSSEGMKRCPNCGTGNLVTDTNCSSCGKRLPG
jgi:zinc-ribbon domain